MSRVHDFWKSYLPLSHRYHSINKGEVLLSLRISNNFPRKNIHNPYDLANFALSSLADNNSSGVPRIFLLLFRLDSFLIIIFVSI